MGHWTMRNMLFLVVFIYSLGRSLSATKSVITIKNSKLCNISPASLSLNKFSHCITATQASSTCDLRKETLKCRGMEIYLDGFKSEEYNSVLRSISVENSLQGDDMIRQVIITTKNVQRKDLSMIGSLVDKFLTPNLWWYVEYETHDWHFSSKPHNSTITHEIVLERYNELYEPHLRHLASVQYTDSQTCGRVAMGMGWQACIGPGWSSVLQAYHKHHSEMPYGVYATHTSISNNLLDNTAFITGSDCPNTMNKWDCAFLTMTNCSIPKAMFECTDLNCVVRTPGKVFNNATEHGELVGNRTSAWYKATMQNSQTPKNDLQRQWSYARQAPPFVYQQPYNHTSNDMKFMKSTHVMGSNFALFQHHFLIRPNSFYRSRITQLLHQFYAKNNVTPKTRCVASHIRRGDRIIKGVNMSEFCRNWSQPITQSNPINYCQDSSGILKNCDTLKRDMGCEYGVPFGAVTLHSVVNKATKLVPPEVRTLIVFTDDEAWLNTEIIALKHTHPNWRILILDAPKTTTASTGYKNNTGIYKTQDTGYHYMRSTGGTESGVYFHASLELAQQCEAFVAHFASGVPLIFYSKMCDQHGAGRSQSVKDVRDGDGNDVKQGVCPPIYDLRVGL